MEVVNIINKRVFNGSKQKELTDLWKLVDSDMTLCTFILTRGDRKNKPCNKPCNKSSVNGKCSIHSETKSVNHKPMVKKEPCMMFIRNGPNSGTRCKKIDCILHQPIRVKKVNDYYIIKDTNLLFDLKEQVIIGYMKNDQFLFEYNKDVEMGCIQYDLEYKK